MNSILTARATFIGLIAAASLMTARASYGQGALSYSISKIGTRVFANGKIPRQYLFDWIAENAPFPVGKADEFPGDPIDLTGTNLPWNEFIARLSYVQPFELVQGQIIGALYNPAPLEDGEVQISFSSSSVVLRAKKAKADTCYRVLGEITGFKINVSGSSPDITGSFAAANPREIASKLGTYILANSGNHQSAAQGSLKLSAPAGGYSSWPITFTSGDLLTLENGSFKRPSSSSTPRNLADLINSMYGQETAAPGSNVLILKGDPQKIYRVKEALAKWIDVPYDQVRLDLWAYSGSDRKHNEAALAQRLELIQAGVRLAKAYENALTSDLERFILNDEIDGEHFSKSREIYELFGAFGLLDPNRNLDYYQKPTLDPWGCIKNERDRIRPFVDQLIYLSLAPSAGYRERLKFYLGARKVTAPAVLCDFEAALDSRLKAQGMQRIAGDLSQVEIAGQLKRLSATFRQESKEPFRRLSTLIENRNSGLAVKTVLDIMKAYRNCRWEAEERTDPERLTTLASTSDALIKNATDAISSDIKSMVIEPLNRWVQEVSALKSAGKPVLILDGHQSITVTSAQPAATAAKVETFLPFTPTQTTDKAAIGAIESGLSGVNPFSGAGAIQALKTLAELTQPATQYARLGTGFSMFVRPTVLPGGRAARLVIEATMGADLEKKRGDTGDTLSSYESAAGPVDRINSQMLATDVQVNTFDLFELSSFSIASTGPGDRRWSIPILDGIPILGSMFRGPRGTVSSVHRSLVICHATILPKTLDVARRYDHH